MPNEICEYCNVELCCYAVDQGVRQGLLENTAFDNRLDCNYTAHGYNFSQSDIDWCADPYICGPCYGDAKFSMYFAVSASFDEMWSYTVMGVVLSTFLALMLVVLIITVASYSRRMIYNKDYMQYKRYYNSLVLLPIFDWLLRWMALVYVGYLIFFATWSSGDDLAMPENKQSVCCSELGWAAMVTISLFAACDAILPALFLMQRTYTFKAFFWTMVEAMTIASFVPAIMTVQHYVPVDGMSRSKFSTLCKFVWRAYPAWCYFIIVHFAVRAYVRRNILRQKRFVLSYICVFCSVLFVVASVQMVYASRVDDMPAYIKHLYLVPAISWSLARIPFLYYCFVMETNFWRKTLVYECGDENEERRTSANSETKKEGRLDVGFVPAGGDQNSKAKSRRGTPSVQHKRSESRDLATLITPRRTHSSSSSAARVMRRLDDSSIVEVQHVLYKYRKFMIDFCDITYDDHIGSGASATVYRGRYRGNKDIAIKVYTPSEISAGLLSAFTAEIELVKPLVHPNIVGAVGVVVAPPNVATVFTLCENGSLNELLKDQMRLGQMRSRSNSFADDDECVTKTFAGDNEGSIPLHSVDTSESGAIGMFVSQTSRMIAGVVESASDFLRPSRKNSLSARVPSLSETMPAGNVTSSRGKGEIEMHHIGPDGAVVVAKNDGGEGENKEEDSDVRTERIEEETKMGAVSISVKKQVATETDTDEVSKIGEGKLKSRKLEESKHCPTPSDDTSEDMLTSSTSHSPMPCRGRPQRTGGGSVDIEKDAGDRKKDVDASASKENAAGDDKEEMLTPTTTTTTTTPDARLGTIMVTADLHFVSPDGYSCTRGGTFDEQGELLWTKRLIMVKELCDAVHFLHSRPKPVLHRDIKPHNVLLGNDFTIILADFGESRRVRLKEQMVDLNFPEMDRYLMVCGTKCKACNIFAWPFAERHASERNGGEWEDHRVDSTLPMTIAGSPLWMAPEVLKGKHGMACYDTSADVYSTTIVAWQILSLSEPYGGENAFDVVEQVIEGRRPIIPKEWPRAVRNVIADGMRKMPKDRPSAFAMLRTFEACISEHVAGRTSLNRVVSFKSASGYYLGATESGKLEWNRTSIGDREIFQCHNLWPKPSCISLLTYNNRWVSVAKGGIVSANIDGFPNKPGLFGRFQLVKIDTRDSQGRHRLLVALRDAHGHFLKAPIFSAHDASENRQVLCQGFDVRSNQQFDSQLKFERSAELITRMVPLASAMRTNHTLASENDEADVVIDCDSSDSDIDGGTSKSRHAFRSPPVQSAVSRKHDTEAEDVEKKKNDTAVVTGMKEPKPKSAS